MKTARQALATHLSMDSVYAIDDAFYYASKEASNEKFTCLNHNFYVI